jgi:hypothetical protein
LNLETAVDRSPPLAVDLAANDSYALFDVVLNAEGSHTYFNGLSNADSGNIYRWYDTGGVLLSQGNAEFYTANQLPVPRSGHYLLAVARNTGSAPGGTALQFALNLETAVGRIQVRCFWNPWQGENHSHSWLWRGFSTQPGRSKIVHLGA